MKPKIISRDYAIKPAGRDIVGLGYSDLWEIFSYFEDDNEIRKNQYAGSIVLSEEDLRKALDIIRAAIARDQKVKIITGARRVGKTFELIKESAKTGNYIVCHSKQECSRILSEAVKHKLNIPMPISYYEFMNKQYYGKHINGFLIDDIDRFLWMISNVPINTVTFSMFPEIEQLKLDNENRTLYPSTTTEE